MGSTDFHSSKELRNFETAVMKSSTVTSSQPTDLSLSQSFNFSSSDEDLEEPKEVLPPNLSDHEENDIDESPSSANFLGEHQLLPPRQKSTNKIVTSPTSLRHQRYEHHKPHAPPRIYRRVQQQNRGHYDVIAANTSSPVPKMRFNVPDSIKVDDVRNSNNDDVSEMGKVKQTTNSSGYSSPASSSISVTSSNTSSSYQLSAVPLINCDERPRCRSSGVAMRTLPELHRSDSVIPPELNRHDSVASSTPVDYTLDVKLPSGNTINLIEDANSLARHKHQSDTLSGKPPVGKAPVVRRRRDGWKHGTTSFEHHDMTSSPLRGANNEQRRSVPSFPFTRAQYKKNDNVNEWNYINEKDFSASLANLAKATQYAPLAPSDGSDRPFSTISVSRMMSQRDSYHHDGNMASLQDQPHTASLWSLNYTDHNSVEFHNTFQPAAMMGKKRPSIKHRLKGAFSFQNIRRAISMERVADVEPYRQKSVKTCDSREEMAGSGDNTSSGRLRKAPSITSLISTVRMRKKKSKVSNRLHRNTIAIDTFNLENIAEKERLSSTVRSSIHIGSPNYFRPIGRVLHINAIEGSVLVEIVRPPSGPYGFYLGRQKDSKNVYISSLNDGYPAKMYAGLMQLGDEVTEINGIRVDGLSLDVINDIIIDSAENVRLRVKPGKVHRV